MKQYLCVLCGILFFTHFTFTQSGTINTNEKYPKRELRGAWIATVKNIDWPSTNQLTTNEQKSELVNIFDKLKEAGINIVYFQIRTECDALYNSPYEPWSYWLTGEQGKAPDPYYDPLLFAIQLAHSRGMEIEAWFNPYRAVRSIGDYKISPTHVSETHPDWILNFGESKILNPGIPAVTDYIVKIVSDVVKRYNIDGVHFDDYFYPYVPHITNQDSATFAKYKGSFTNIDDWRRNNVNNMIAKVYKAVNRINPRVRFGVSPFGIVENKYAGTDGFNAYDKIYCDPLAWLKDKTVDYVVPQLYVEIGNNKMDYKKLAYWWATVTNGRQLFIGQFSSKMMAPDWKGSPSEIGDEIRLNRSIKNIEGEVFFSAKSISQNYSGLIDTLKKFYKYPALLPVMTWKDSSTPPTPMNLDVDGNTLSLYRRLTWDMPYYLDKFKKSFNYVIYRFEDTDNININDATKIVYITHNGNTSYTDFQPLSKGKNYTYVVTAIDCMQKESPKYDQVKIKIE